MKEDVRALVEEVGASSGSVSEITLWKETSGEMKRVFYFVTTAPVDAQEVEDEIRPGMEIHARETDIGSLLSTVPEELGSTLRYSAEYEYDRPEFPDSLEYDVDARVVRRTSSEMASLGVSSPALCVELWPKGPEFNSSEFDDVEPLLSAFYDQYGVDLRNEPAKLGNALIAVEDPRARVSLSESSAPDDIIDRLYDDEETLSEGELVELSDVWEVDLCQVTRDMVDIVSSRSEFGHLLYEKRLDTSDDNQLTESETASRVREKNIQTTVLVTDENGTAHYPLPEYSAPGASDETFKVLKEGIRLDKDSVGVIRGIGFDIDVRAPGATEVESPQTPDQIFSDSEHQIGPPVWENRIPGFGPSVATNTWVIESDDDYDEIMQDIYSRFSGRVKILDPYLRPGRLSEFVNEATPDAEFWVMIGFPSGQMKDLREGFKDCVTEANDLGVDLNIRWVPSDNSPPLHDRFILAQEGGLVIGTSFNSLDDNLSVVYEIQDDSSGSLEQNFDKWWTDSQFEKEHEVDDITPS